MRRYVMLCYVMLCLIFFRTFSWAASSPDISVCSSDDFLWKIAVMSSCGDDGDMQSCWDAQMVTKLKAIAAGVVGGTAAAVVGPGFEHADPSAHLTNSALTANQKAMSNKNNLGLGLASEKEITNEIDAQLKKQEATLKFLKLKPDLIKKKIAAERAFIISKTRELVAQDILNRSFYVPRSSGEYTEGKILNINADGQTVTMQFDEEGKAKIKTVNIKDLRAKESFMGKPVIPSAKSKLPPEFLEKFKFIGGRMPSELSENSSALAKQLAAAEEGLASRFVTRTALYDLGLGIGRTVAGGALLAGAVYAGGKAIDWAVVKTCLHPGINESESEIASMVENESLLSHCNFRVPMPNILKIKSMTPDLRKKYFANNPTVCKVLQSQLDRDLKYQAQFKEDSVRVKSCENGVIRFTQKIGDETFDSSLQMDSNRIAYKSNFVAGYNSDSRRSYEVDFDQSTLSPGLLFTKYPSVKLGDPIQMDKYMTKFRKGQCNSYSSSDQEKGSSYKGWPPDLACTAARSATQAMFFLPEIAGECSQELYKSNTNSISTKDSGVR